LASVGSPDGNRHCPLETAPDIGMCDIKRR
jgi:hypothetical protein